MTLATGTQRTRARMSSPDTATIPMGTSAEASSWPDRDSSSVLRAGQAVHLTSHEGIMSEEEVAKERELERQRAQEGEEIEAFEIQGKKHVLVEAELMVPEGDTVFDLGAESGDDGAEADDGASGAETVAAESNVVEVTEVSHALAVTNEAMKARRKKKARALVNLTSCDYAVVRDACKRFGWRFTNSDKAWTIKWTDRYLIGQTLREMKLLRPQRINHFPAMCEIAFKCRLGHNLNRLRKLCPEAYDFYPETWVLPDDLAAFTKVTNEKKNRTYIVKPNCGSQGHGIFLTRAAKEVPKEGKFVAQRYLNRPLLIDNLKFDLRIYVLITSVTPLRLYVLREGLARFCTQEYQSITAKNRNQQFMHLTNYAINKHNEDFEAPTGGVSCGMIDRLDGADGDGGEVGEGEGGGAVGDGESGSKRSISSVRRWLDANGFDSNKVWADTTALIAKTVIAALPANQHAYRMAMPEGRDSAGFTCFTVLGFDVILDHMAVPNLIEVNELPSFETDSELDQSIKMRAVHEALQMVAPTVQECKLLRKFGAAAPGQKVSLSDEGYVKQRRELVDLRIQQENAWCSLYECIYPGEDPGRRELLDKCIEKSEQAYKQSFYGPSESQKERALKAEAAAAADKLEQEKALKAKRERAAALMRASRPKKEEEAGLVGAAGDGTQQPQAPAQAAGFDADEGLPGGLFSCGKDDAGPLSGEVGSVSRVGADKQVSGSRRGGTCRPGASGAPGGGKLEPGLRKDVLRAGQVCVPTLLRSRWVFWREV